MTTVAPIIDHTTTAQDHPTAPITLPPYLTGEHLQLFIVSAAGTRLVDAEVSAFAPDGDGYAMTVHLSPERETFALTPAPADPTSQPCDGCGAGPEEPCRWGCLNPEHTR